MRILHVFLWLSKVANTNTIVKSIGVNIVKTHLGEQIKKPIVQKVLDVPTTTLIRGISQQSHQQTGFKEVC